MICEAYARGTDVSLSFEVWYQALHVAVNVAEARAIAADIVIRKSICNSMLMMFPQYRFEHPVTGRQINVRGLSYVSAALLGPIFVAIKSRRFGSTLYVALISLLFTIVIISILIASIHIGATYGFRVLIFLIPAALAVHGRFIVFSLRNNLRARGRIIRTLD